MVSDRDTVLRLLLAGAHDLASGKPLTLQNGPARHAPLRDDFSVISA